VRLVKPPQDAPEGWDLADAAWSQEEAASYVKENISAVERTPDPEPDPEPIKPAKGGHFTCLGFDGDSYYYQPHRTGQVVRLARASHTGTNLCALAPLPYWETLYPSRTGANWTAAASSLFEQQAAVGVYSPDRIRGRGAWWDDGRAILHLGDRLIVNGLEQGITDRLPKSPYLYQRLAAIEGFTGLSPLTDEEAFPLLDLASRFHWEVPASGLLIAGWVTLAPICGAMEWRPHAWLTAAAGSGKSAILDRYVGPLLGPVALWPEGNTTEAFIRQELRADALPVVFDEAESNEKRDQDRIQSILSLARVASSSGRGVIGKGSADGSSQRFIIRSMFLMSSIATALKQGADKSRFAQLTLRNPAELPKAERTAHWDSLDRDLDRFITEEIGRRLLIRTTNLIPIIRASAKVFRRVAADHFDSQRLGDQYGTLLAGAWSLMSSEIVTEAQARQLISENDWEPYSQATEVPDERRCIQRILQQQIRVESDRSNYMRTIGELVDLALKREMDMDIGASLAQGTLGRHGVKVDGDAVLISNNAEAIATILRDTPWSNCWPTVLTRLPGSTKAGSIYFKGSGTTSRAVRVPLSAIDRTDSA
jgi:putative DNA primase/helicase